MGGGSVFLMAAPEPGASLPAGRWDTLQPCRLAWGPGDPLRLPDANSAGRPAPTPPRGQPCRPACPRSPSKCSVVTRPSATMKAIF